MMLLAPPMQPPNGYIPKVHSIKGDSKETSKRALEATRLVPAISKESWEQILDEPWDTLASWPVAPDLRITFGLAGLEGEHICRR